MLFHITLRHDIANCPGFNPEIMQRVMETYAGLDEIGARHDVSIREHYQAAPDHVEFMVADAPSNMHLAMFFSEALPYKVDFETRAVADRAQMREYMEHAQR